LTERQKTASSLLDLVRDKDVRLEEYARHVIAMESAHQDEVNKMLRKPCQTEAFTA
jgi:bacterioferritin